MRLTLKSVQQQAQTAGYEVEKVASGYTVNGQTFRLLAEVVNYLNTCLEAPVSLELTINEVQQIAQQMDFLVQPAFVGYEIFYHGQVLGLAKKLSEVVEVLPQYKEAIAKYYEAELLEQVVEPEIEFVDIDGFYNFEALVKGEMIAELSHDAFNSSNPWYVSVSGIEVYRSALYCEATDWVKSQYVAGTLSQHEAQKVQVLTTRSERAATIEVLEQHGDEFIVHNCENNHYYVVRPNHVEPKERCECADCHYRGVKCKHQIAVEKFLAQSLEQAIPSVALPLDDLLDIPFDELTAKDWERLREYSTPTKSMELVAA
ncbi:MAG: hypothetical protein V7L23_29865 [Nostoc sp.]|uniref:hypothetical protein n=1 Tax=Nostoc sp. TaxID=1180 RepID=UPI002FF1F538